MIDAIVKITGSIFCLGIGTALFAFGIMVLSVFTMEVYSHIKDKR